MNLTFISQYLTFVDEYKSSAKSKRLLVIPLEFDGDSDLHFFSPYLQTL